MHSDEGRSPAPYSRFFPHFPLNSSGRRFSHLKRPTRHCPFSVVGTLDQKYSASIVDDRRIAHGIWRWSRQYHLANRLEIVGRNAGSQGKQLNRRVLNRPKPLLLVNTLRETKTERRRIPEPVSYCRKSDRNAHVSPPR
ncbi:MAG TPA: hypothetical protein PLC98_25350 [Anaerolineales bacterium]|nr:hypothetical protein [Anaerolineales bacterium]